VTKEHLDGPSSSTTRADASVASRRVSSRSSTAGGSWLSYRSTIPRPRRFSTGWPKRSGSRRGTLRRGTDPSSATAQVPCRSSRRCGSHAPSPACSRGFRPAPSTEPTTSSRGVEPYLGGWFPIVRVRVDSRKYSCRRDLAGERLDRELLSGSLLDEPIPAHRRPGREEPLAQDLPRLGPIDEPAHRAP